MARVQYKSKVFVSKTINNDNWAGQPESAVITDELDDAGTLIMTIEAGDTDIELKPAKPTEVKFIYLKITPADPNEELGELLVKFNDVEVGAITPLPGAKEAEWKLCISGITSIKVTNEGANDISLISSLAGDNPA